MSTGSFADIIAQKRSGENKVASAPVPVPSSPAPVAVPVERPQAKLARSADKHTYVSSTVLIERRRRNRIAAKLAVTGDPRDYSELMEELAEHWLQEEPRMP